MSLWPLDRQLSERLSERRVPISRSFSLLNPSWDVGHWDDFHDFGAFLRSMDRQFRMMDQQLNEMFSHFNRLAPMDGAQLPSLERLTITDRDSTTPQRRSTDLSLTPYSPAATVGSPSHLVEGFGFKNPITTNADGSRQLKLQFDVRNFKPEELEIKTLDNKLMVHAKHQEESENSQVYREYQRQFLLPEGIELDKMKSVLSPEGVLTVEAPLPTPEVEAPKERVIPIEHQTSTEAITKD
jgi:HSP20 family molecular chaperone IbpA